MKIKDLFEIYGPVSPTGIGSIPFNQNIDYMGLRVLMRPSIFLKAAARLSGDRERKVDELVGLLNQGELFGNPVLWIKFNDKMFDDLGDGDFIYEEAAATVVGHEGRHRMEAIMKAYGDIPVEVHLLFNRMNRSDITREHINLLKKEIKQERTGLSVRRPIIRIL